MEFGELRHLLDDVIREAQGRESLAHHARTHHLVMVEGHAAIGLEAPRLGFADVMQECGESQHEVRGRGRRVVRLQIDGLLHDRQ